MNKRQKKKQIRMRNKRLVKRYPFLLPRNVWTDKVREDYNYEYTEYDCIDAGWRKCFGKLLLEDLREALVKTNYLYDFRFMQIKEKFGSLRLYCNGAPQEVHDVLSKYEFISQYVCIQCGSPYACVVDDYGWYLPLCENCWNKQNKIREKKGYKTVSYEEVVDEEHIELPDSRTVIKFSKEGTDKVVYDISETTKKIKMKYEKKSKKDWV